MKSWKDIVPESLQENLSAIKRSKYYQEKESVFLEREPYRGFFIVESGVFRVFNVDAEGRESVLHIFRAGDMIAGSPIFENDTMYPAFCECLSPGTASLYPADRFRILLHEHPSFMFDFSSLVLLNLYRFRMRLNALLFLTVKERLLEFFVELGAEKHYVYLPVPKQQIALLLGTTPESVSRALKSLLSEGELTETSEGYKIPERIE